MYTSIKFELNAADITRDVFFEKLLFRSENEDEKSKRKPSFLNDRFYKR